MSDWNCCFLLLILNLKCQFLVQLSKSTVSPSCFCTNLNHIVTSNFVPSCFNPCSGPTVFFFRPLLAVKTMKIIQLCTMNFWRMLNMTWERLWLILYVIFSIKLLQEIWKGDSKQQKYSWHGYFIDCGTVVLEMCWIFQGWSELGLN